jgi:hypothetical protein
LQSRRHSVEMAGEGIHVKIEVLDTDNYAVWAPQMQLLLMHKGNWKGVTDPAADADLSDMV